MTVRLDEIEVKPSELVYVTATNYEERTFFAQQCKYTNKDLVDHNSQIHDYCKRLYETSLEEERHNIQPVVGEVLCTRYNLDKNWYRMMVQSCDDQARESICYFVDYGNVERVSYDYLLRVDPINLPTITRAPFGFFATMMDSDKLDKDRSNHLLDCLMNEYLLVREQGRLKDNLWRVELPKVAYNTTFWVASERVTKYT